MRKQQQLKQATLLPLIYSMALNTTAQTFTYTVPAGKRWSVIHVGMIREFAGNIAIAIVDTSGTTIDLVKELASLKEYYEPNNKIIMPAGWSIKLYYYVGLSGWLEGQMLVEEEEAY